ncbi:hypothetical protein PACTADRAFT_80063 [Pachysolen tannophilus NRRL Y-2460]|uniref:FAD/NAD(P)-binding domain-containing protein n=1 Tax=Pachysolen tannophilus NRRL Y-2460 TaxID=669874 RepID=A0A1E4TW47_PACTA|nr:hypothetical protein PACTADRAFT_80063 [Pachysolen tannophilus NRRL Y-2460]
MSLPVIKILVVGGSYGGNTFLKFFLKLVEKYEGNSPRFDITLVEPRRGFINILAIPKAVLDPEFAKTTYATIENMGLPFDFLDSTSTTSDSSLRLRYIQGWCHELHENYAIVKPVDNSAELSKYEFDYCIYAAGRSRPWPFDPKGFDKKYYLEEMEKSTEKIKAANIISVIGAGAVGIEVAAELKTDFPEKKVLLIHPHDNLPPENRLSQIFKQKNLEFLKDVKVEVKLNTRVLKEVENGFLTTNGDFVESDLILWCSSKQNNLKPLLNNEKSPFKDCIDYKVDDIAINRNMQIIRYDESSYDFSNATVPAKFEKIFAIGDVSKIPAVKAAGGAYRQAIVAAENVMAIVRNELYNEQNELKMIDLWGAHMTLLVGPRHSVTQNDDELLLDNADTLKLYEDYCNDFVSKTQGIKFD